MAKNNRTYVGGAKRSSSSYRKTKKSDRAKQMRELAYNMGCVERGLKNPDSQISASYNAGKNKTKKVKKSLY